MHASPGIAFDLRLVVNHAGFTMKTATVRDLRTKFPAIARQLEDGEEISITRRGKLVARLLPPEARARRRKVDWSKSAAANLPRTGKPMAAKQVAALLEYAKGTY